MPCPHNEITIVQRSQRQSAVAAAAYQSGEKLFCEYDQQVKHYPEKRGIDTKTDNYSTVLRTIRAFLAKPIEAVVNKDTLNQEWVATTNEWRQRG